MIDFYFFGGREWRGTKNAYHTLPHDLTPGSEFTTDITQVVALAQFRLLENRIKYITAGAFI
jgi:hypothetical protein